MPLQRIILEMGTGNDLYGEDYTKACRRAIHDALHHSSLTLFRSLKLDRDAMVVDVTLGVQKPEEVDIDTVAAEIPYGTVNVKAVLGGLNVVDEEAGTVSVIASAAVAAKVDVPDGKFVLKKSG